MKDRKEVKNMKVRTKTKGAHVTCTLTGAVVQKEKASN